MPDVATDSSGTNTAESQPSTLSNLSEQVASHMTGNETSESEGAQATTQPEGTQAAAPETKAAETTAEDTGKVTRLEQDNARKDAVLKAIGIDPEGEIVDHLSTGIVDADYIREKYLSKPEPKPVSQEVPLNQKITNLRDSLDKQGKSTDGVSNTDYLSTQNTLLEVVDGLANKLSTYENRERESSVVQYQNQCIDATKNVYGESETFRSLPDTSKDIAGAMILGATDLGVAQLAAQVGQERAFTTKGYSAVAKDVTTEFDALVKSAYDTGHAAALAELKGNALIPLKPTTGGAPVTQPKGDFSLDNLRDNTTAFMDGKRLTV